LSLDGDVRRLSGVRPFNALPREALQLLAFSCEKRRLRAGEPLFAAGEAADGAYFVLEGEIVLRRGESERRAAVGALIGETALIAETLRPADASAASDSLLLRIPSATFRRVLSEFPHSAVEIRRAAAGRAGALVARLDAIRRRAFVAPSGR
jgi:CRP-like cAMP-binding protein